MKAFPAIPLVVTVLAGGCASSPSSSTPVVDGFRPDGAGGPNPVQVAALERGEGDGIVVRFAPGDEIVLDVRVAGDVVRAREGASLTFVVEQAVEVWMGPEGARLRTDGGPWRTALDFLEGSLSTGLSLSNEERVNRVEVSVEANRH